MKWSTAVNSALCHICLSLFCFIFNFDKLQRSARTKGGKKQHFVKYWKARNTQENKVKLGVSIRSQIRINYFFPSNPTDRVVPPRIRQVYPFPLFPVLGLRNYLTKYGALVIDQPFVMSLGCHWPACLASLLSRGSFHKGDEKEKKKDWLVQRPHALAMNVWSFI